MSSYQIRQLKSSLAKDVLHSLVEAIVHCTLDYCNSMLAGVAKVYLRKLQSLQNMSARIVYGVQYTDVITSSQFLKILHWLPIS